MIHQARVFTLARLDPFWLKLRSDTGNLARQ